jgi:hypothetical protein
MGYLETSELSSIDLAKINTKRIVVLASWQIERVIGKADLFWSSASFQEMEPHVVRNYIKIIQPITSQYVYLLQKPHGQRIAKEKGEVGVLKQTRLEDYIEFLDEFKLAQQHDAFIFSGSRDVNYSQYVNMLFQRVGH